jgi:hypothetical protein
MRDLVGSFSFFLVDCGILDSVISLISSDVIGWCYKTFQTSFGFENKRRSGNAFDT